MTCLLKDYKLYLQNYSSFFIICSIAISYSPIFHIKILHSFNSTLFEFVLHQYTLIPCKLRARKRKQTTRMWHWSGPSYPVRITGKQHSGCR